MRKDCVTCNKGDTTVGKVKHASGKATIFALIIYLLSIQIQTGAFAQTARPGQLSEFWQQSLQQASDGRNALASVNGQNSQYMIIPHPLGMLSPDKQTTVSWDELIPLDCYFRFGTFPGNYTVGSVPENGQTRQASFVPSQVGLGSPGVYYGVITNSPDATISADEYRSPEFLVIIESQSTAEIIGPKGTVTDPTPMFEWQPVDGVPYYHVIVSDNPVEIIEDENGETTVQGANIIWQAITPNTSIRYGDVDPSDYFTVTNGTPPPLMTGLTYNWLVLNNYGNHPALTSTVQASVNEFVADIPSNLDAPVLVAPLDSSLITGDVITFQWDAVDGAVNYKISIFEQREENGSNITFPVWETITSNTLVDFPAGNYLINSDYVWKVLAWDDGGGGVQSSDFHFTYATSIGTMKIRTKSSGGQNLPRVEVTVIPVEGSADLIPLVTDGAGFAKKILRDGIYDLTAKKDGYENTTRRVTLPADPYPDSSAGDFNVEIVLTESPGSISGRVYDTAGGGGISNATVVATRTSDATQKTTSTDAEGNFLFGVTSGSWDIYAKKTGYTQSATKTVTSQPGSTIDMGQQALGITLKSGTLNGVVRTTSGKNLQGALVRASSAADTVTTTTAANGTYQMTLTSQTWTVEVEKTGYVSPQPLSRHVPVNGIATADFSLTPHANLISGYVSDGSRSLANTTITATPDAGSPVTAVTNNLGQYSLSLGSGTFTLTASRSGYSGGQPVQVSVTVGETVSGVDFTLTPNPSAISGRVTTDGVTGVAGATVTNGTVSATTTSSGNFSLSLSAGTHTIYATKDGYATSASQELSLAPGQSLSGVDLRITPNAATISGKVTGNGLPLYQAQVTVAGDAGTFQTQTGVQGQYSISVEPGDYAVSASKTGYLEPASQNVTAHPGQSVPDIDFALILNKATISGLVTNASGEFLRNATVTATDDDDAGNTSTTTTNVSGEFTLKVTGGRSYTLLVGKDGYASAQDSLGLLVAGSKKSKNFSLTALPSSIAGTVRDGSGNPVAEAVVAAGSDRATTNHLGKYALYLQAGDKTLTVTKPGYTPASQSVTVGPGQNLTGIDFQLQDVFAALEGTISANGAPLEGVLLALSGANGTASAITSVQGAFTFANLIPGTYQLSLSRDGYAKKDTTLTLAENETKTVKASLVRLTGFIAGAVFSGGNPLAEATVKAISDEGTYSAITNQQGRYTLSGLPKTGYRVSAIRGGYTSPAAAENVVPDSSGVNFTLTANKARLAGVVKEGEFVLENVQISVKGAKGNTGFAESGANGSFAIENLAADTYTVTASKPGYVMPDDSLQVGLAPGADTTVTLTLEKISLQIAGHVRAGNAPQADIPLELRGGGIVRTKKTDGNGWYAFGGLQPNTSYTVATNIFKAGYSEADTTVQLQMANAGNVDLQITIAAAEIFGNVGVGQASVVAEHADGRSFSASSKSDGSYKISRLPAGSYVVRASKSGYVADPEQRSLNLAATDSKEANFSLTPNVGTIRGIVSAAGGGPLSGVSVTAVTDSLAPFSTSSGSDGGYSLIDLPAGRSYTVSVALEGYRASGGAQKVMLKKDQNLTVDFTLLAKNGEISGRVLAQGSGKPIPQALVALQNTESGQSVTQTTNDAGSFGFASLAAGTYRLTVARASYTPVNQEQTVVLAEGEKKSVTVYMQAETGKLRGVVRHRQKGVAGAEVKLVGANTFSAVTNGDGHFTLADLPAGTYEIQVDHADYPQIAFPGVKIEKGSDQFLPLSFPGGQLTLRLTNGKSGLPGVKVRIEAPGTQAVVIRDGETELYRGQLQDVSNEKFAYVSDANGFVVTDSSRLAGTYYLTVEKPGYVIPNAQSLQIELGVDEEKTVAIPLVFAHTPVTSGQARDSVRIEMRYTDGLARQNVLRPQLWVKRIGSEVFVARPMQASEKGYEAWIAPHTQSGEVNYYLTADYQAENKTWSYTSQSYTLRLNAKGILYRVHISPGGGVLQKGARAKLVARPVDDTGDNLASAVTARGTVKWQLLSPDSSADLQVDAEDPFMAYLWPRIDGVVSIQVEAELDGLKKLGKAGYQSKTMELQSIDIQAPSQAANTTPFQISFVATSTDSQSMRLDSRWQVEPAAAGTVSENGLFTPAPNFLGDATVSVVDLTSGKSQSVTINLFAVIDSTTEMTFVDGGGMRLQFQKKSVLRRRQIGLIKPTLPAVKKFTSDFQVIGDVYQLLPAGATFEKAPNLMLPKVQSLAKGTPTVGAWQQTRLQWQPLQSSVSDSAVAAFLESFGQFAVLVPNEPLGIRQLSFLPTPFSPKRGPMRIGYVLSSEDGKALITVRIYTMSGDLIRTLADRELQYPGANTALAWDGLTDAGKYARNGRYLVELIAEDVQGQVRELRTVVLVK